MDGFGAIGEGGACPVSAEWSVVGVVRFLFYYRSVMHSICRNSGSLTGRRGAEMSTGAGDGSR